MKREFGSILRFSCKEEKWFALILLVIIAVGFLIIVPAGDTMSKKRKLQAQSECQLRSIGLLVQSFRTNVHTELSRLSQIVPDGRIDLLPIFYAPNRPGEQRPRDWRTDRSEIDLFSDYAVPTNANSSILVFEKPGMWDDGTVAACVTNLTVVRMRIPEFEKVVH